MTGSKLAILLLLTFSLGPALTGVAMAAVPDGACCFGNGVCEELPSFICEDQNGTFIGNDTSCATIVCDAPLAVPMVSIFGLVATAGMLSGIGLYRLLFRSR